ncbi:MAG: superoxide dismutase [Fe] [Legionellales bacterium]|nr:superoxide dismutase [Fe] [Legionellales bacterium]
MTIQLPPLPYEMDALAPHISRETLEYHYGKHHQAYVNNLNNLLPNSGFEGKTLEEMILKASGPLFNNAAQVWNHTFYWNSLTPAHDYRDLSGSLAKAIDLQFGSFAAFKEVFTKSATSLFGSGWTWLIKAHDGKLEIVNTSNAANPMTEGKKPLLTCDVWEHAYYIDVRNARPKYLENFWQVVNWKFAERNFD